MPSNAYGVGGFEPIASSIKLPLDCDDQKKALVSDSAYTGDPKMNPTHQSVTDDVLSRHVDEPGALMPILHDIQAALGFIPADAVPRIAVALNLSRAEVHGVITYYHFFRDKPAGRHVVEVCRAESCKSVGGDALMAHAEQVLGCESHHTRPDGAVTLLPVYCLGLCAMSPNIMIDDKPYGRMSFAKLDRIAARMEIAA